MTMAKAQSDTTSTNEGDGKTKALGLAVDQIEKQFGKGTIMRMGETTQSNVETFPKSKV